MGDEWQTPQIGKGAGEKFSLGGTNCSGPWPPLIKKPALQRVEIERRENFTQFRVRIEVAAGRSQLGFLLVPDGEDPFPAVVVPYYDSETSVGLSTTPLCDFAYQLARRGFVSLAIGAPGGVARQPELALAQCQPLSYLAYIAATCYNALATLTEVVAHRIGIVGHPYGGKWAMFAATLYNKYVCAVWSDPGVVFTEARLSVNYWEPWYLGRSQSYSIAGARHAGESAHGRKRGPCRAGPRSARIACIDGASPISRVGVGWRGGSTHTLGGTQSCHRGESIARFHRPGGDDQPGGARSHFGIQ